MRYPTLRYGNPAQLQYYAIGIPVKDLAKGLRRSERSVRDWMNGTKKVPWWVPEILRLQHMEHQEIMRQMNIQPAKKKLGIVSDAGTIIQYQPRPNQASIDSPQAPPRKSLVR